MQSRSKLCDVLISPYTVASRTLWSGGSQCKKHEWCVLHTYLSD